MYDIKQTIENEVSQSVAVGAVAYLIAKYGYGADSQSILVMGNAVSVPVVVGIGGALSNMGSAIVHDVIEKQYPDNGVFEAGSAFARPVINSAVTYAVFKALNPSANLLPAIVVGGASSVGGDYLNRAVWDLKQ